MNMHTVGHHKGMHRVATILGHAIESTDGEGQHARKQGRKRVATILDRIRNERQASTIEPLGWRTADEQWAEVEKWANHFRNNGYGITIRGTGEPAPFHQEYVVWNDHTEVATMDIDGCGGSWHGPDGLWLGIVGPHVEMVSQEMIDAVYLH